MTRYLTAVSILCGGLGLSAVRTSAQLPVVTGTPAIADTVARLFAGIGEATTALDLDRLLSYYEDTEALTYVARGRITRSRAAFADLLDTQLRGLAGADLRWRDIYLDVLSDDVATATATYEFTATLPDGRIIPTAGTYMCIFVRREGRWLVGYSTHTFPASQP